MVNSKDGDMQIRQKEESCCFRLHSKRLVKVTAMQYSVASVERRESVSGLKDE